MEPSTQTWKGPTLRSNMLGSAFLPGENVCTPDSAYSNGTSHPNILLGT